MELTKRLCFAGHATQNGGKEFQLVNVQAGEKWKFLQGFFHLT